MRMRLKLLVVMVVALAVVLLCGCRTYYDPWNGLYVGIDELGEWWEVYSEDEGFAIAGTMVAVHQNRFYTVYRSVGLAFYPDLVPEPVDGVRLWLFEDHWRGRVTGWLYVPGGPTVRIHGLRSAPTPPG